jgi:hypothetical protein
MHQNGEKYTKWPQTLPIGHKIYQLAIKNQIAVKHTNIFQELFDNEQIFFYSSGSIMAKVKIKEWKRLPDLLDQQTQILFR